MGWLIFVAGFLCGVIVTGILALWLIVLALCEDIGAEPEPDYHGEHVGLRP